MTDERLVRTAALLGEDAQRGLAVFLNLDQFHGGSPM